MSSPTGDEVDDTESVIMCAADVVGQCETELYLNSTISTSNDQFNNASHVATVDDFQFYHFYKVSDANAICLLQHSR